MSSSASLHPLLLVLNEGDLYVQETRSALSSYDEYEEKLSKRDRVKRSHLAVTEDPKAAAEYARMELEKYWSEGGPEANFKMFHAVMSPSTHRLAYLTSLSRCAPFLPFPLCCYGI